MTKLRLRLRPLVMIASAVAALALIASDADARVGGSRSSGSRGSQTYSAPPSTSTAPKAGAPMERTMTQPGQPGAALNRPAAPAAQPGGFFNRPGMGMLGGLAAGFLGAGLLGMLMGHGFLGGLGGLASMLGLLLQVGLVALVAMLAWRWWQRRSQPAHAMAGGPSLRDAQPDQRPSFGGLGGFGGGAAAGGMAAAPVTREISLQQGDFDAFEKLLSQIQAAWSNEDLTAMKSLATAEMASYFAEDLQANASRGVVNKVTDVKLLQGDLAEAWGEGNSEYATVAMRFALTDKTLDRATGRVVEGGDRPQEATELWTFVRTPGGQWQLSAIQQPQ
jgi:predicted lipid-binding transport protein (Tim44 family)